MKFSENFRLEPFARFYLSDENASAGLKIARGMYGSASELPLYIDEEIGLAGNGIENQGVYYSFGGGITVNHGRIEREIEENPSYKSELEYIKQYFSEIETGHLINLSHSESETLAAQSNACWGGGWGGHSNPDYDMLLHFGTDGIRRKINEYKSINNVPEFYLGLETALDALDKLGERYADYAEKMAENASGKIKERYLRISNAMRIIPKNPAYDFFSAVQMFWLVFRFDGIDSPGRLDQFLIDYYVNSDKADSREILENLWLAFYKTRTWNLCIGGSDENWNDVSNELTYEILDIAEKFKFNTPNLTMRVHRNTPDDLWKKASEVISTGIGMPALYNDEVMCPALEDLGIPSADSHLYCMNGCNQVDIMGKSHGS